jgi:tetratricopeptide (TPR) repeat protein
LIGWDAADWKMINPLVESGQMPNFARFVNEGVIGNVASLTPMLSPILWTSIATGKHADKHGILGFAEPDGPTGKCRPVTSTSRRCKALWNILSDRGIPSGVVNWFATHPAEDINGFIVSDRFCKAVAGPQEPWPLVPGAVHPADQLEAASRLRVHPALTTQDHLRPFIPRIDDLDPIRDKPVHELRVLLAECATVQRVTTWLMQSRPWEFLGVYFDTIDRLAHVFMDYHPPRRDHVDAASYDLYKDVMNQCYRFHDKMLGRLMNLAGDDTTIIILSDHGFHCDHLRPNVSGHVTDGQPVAWHRRHGVLAIRGPGINRDQRVYGASLLDIAPTCLWLLGQPVAADMDGAALTQIAQDDEDRTLEEIDSFETPGEPNVPDVDVAEDVEASRVVMQRLLDLGYLDSIDSVEKIINDRTCNLAQVYASTGRTRAAIDEYQKVLEADPENRGIQMAIATCWLDLGKLDECEVAVDRILVGKDAAPQALFYKGIIAFRRGQFDEALRLLGQAAELAPEMASLRVQMGNVYLKRRRFEKAEVEFRAALNIDIDHAEAHDGLGAALRNQGRSADAVVEHMRSVALLHHRPQTHIHLGMALAEVGRFRWAEKAFRVAIEQNPESLFAHRCLGELYRQGLNDPIRAEQHFRRAQELGNTNDGDRMAS